MLAELDAGGLHRQRVGTDIPHGIDAAVRRRIAGAANAGCAQRRIESHGLASIDPTDVEAGLPLHRDALTSGALFILGCGEDQVTELAEARVRPEEVGLAPVKVDAPATKGDRGRCSALRPDHARRPPAGASTDPSPITDQAPSRACRPSETGGQPA